MAFTLPAHPTHRPPFPHEIQAAVDFQSIDAGYDDAIARLLDAWQTIRADQIAELLDQIRAIGDDPVRLATIQATPRGGDVLARELEAVAADALAGARSEAIGQGLTVPEVDETAVAARARAAAQALDMVLAAELSNAARRQALNRVGAPTMAEDVGAHLDNLTDAWLTSQFNGAVTTAGAIGRHAVFDVLEEQSTRSDPTTFYASSLLDTATCEVCAQWDGHRFDTLDEALAQFPTGGNMDCLGGPNCRCLIISVSGSEAAASV